MEQEKPEVIVLSQREAMKKIALHKGAKWFVCHGSMNGPFGYLTMRQERTSDMYKTEEIMEELPEGYGECRPEINLFPFERAEDSKKLRDELCEAACWRITMLQCPNRSGVVFEAIHATKTHEPIVEGPEFEAVVRLYLECVTGIPHRIEVSKESHQRR